jgi:hypothetical protein
MTTGDISQERRRKNVRLILILAAVALFMFVTSIPFWRGLYDMALSSIQ